MSSILAEQPLGSRLNQFYQLAKPRVVSLIVFTAVIGMFLATPGMVPLQTLLAVYPNSNVREEAQREVQEVMEKLAQKDYDTARQYIRQGLLESALIYLEDVVTRYPETEMARQARFRMVEIYRRRDWTPELRETCAVMRTTYPDDPEVREACGDVPPPLGP